LGGEHLVFRVHALRRMVERGIGVEDYPTTRPIRAAELAGRGCRWMCGSTSRRERYRSLDEDLEGDDEPFEEEMQRLVTTLRAQQAEAFELEARTSGSLKRLGYDV
jgi:hypothetical protein